MGKNSLLNPTKDRILLVPSLSLGTGCVGPSAKTKAGLGMGAAIMASANRKHPDHTMNWRQSRGDSQELESSSKAGPVFSGQRHGAPVHMGTEGEEEKDPTSSCTSPASFPCSSSLPILSPLPLTNPVAPQQILDRSMHVSTHEKK